jgi:hypothetical protein
VTVAPSFTLLFPWREDPERRRIFDWVQERWARHFPGVEMCQGASPDGPFNRGAAVNAAARLASTEILVIADADTTFRNPAVIEEALELADTGAPWVLPYTIYYNLLPELTAAILSRPPAAHLGPPDVWEHRLDTAVSGIIVVRRDAFERVGGYDERFVGWGFEDRAFEITLNSLCGRVHRLDGDVLHLWHPMGPRFESPEAAANQQLARQYQRAAGRKAVDALVQEHKARRGAP